MSITTEVTRPYAHLSEDERRDFIAATVEAIDIGHGHADFFDDEPVVLTLERGQALRAVTCCMETAANALIGDNNSNLSAEALEVAGVINEQL